NDLWAVGTFVHPATGTERALADHYDGSTWSITRPPSPGVSAILDDVTALSPSDAWAVGTYLNHGLRSRTLIEHWDGTGWTIVSTPNPGPYTDQLFAVAHVSSGNVWAVGRAEDPSIITPVYALVEHYNGTAWKSVNPASLSARTSELLGVAGSSGSDVWGVGDRGNARGFSRTLIEHYNGSAWSLA